MTFQSTLSSISVTFYEFTHIDTESVRKVMRMYGDFWLSMKWPIWKYISDESTLSLVQWSRATDRAMIQISFEVSQK
jgi:hypothetical protein